ncbi:MAG: DUF3488 domain-containing transglutaminase family protein [Neisseriaceae bacterium]|nr:DUF3488 domain-containing transglutaminase family protein [Neisseriaceae bacterium]
MLAADFIHRPAPIFAQYASLCVLAMIATPILIQLPKSIMIIFALFWVIRMILIKLNIKPLKGLPLALVSIAAIILIFSQTKSLLGQDGGISFLVMMALLKSYESKDIRDWQVLLLASLFLTVGTLLFSQGIVNTLWTALCLFAVLTCLNLLDGGSSKDALKQAARGLIFALPLAVIFFIALPRPENPPVRFMPVAENTTAQTGLSDTLSPGSFSELVQDDEPAFNVVFQNNFVPKNNQLYWKVLIMPDFDGRSWKARQPFFRLDNNEMQERFSGSTNTVHYEIIAKDWNGYFPALDYTTDVPMRQMQLFHTGSTMVWRRSNQHRRFVLGSVLTDRMNENMQDMWMRGYLRLPNGVAPQTRELTAQLLSQSSTDEEFIQQAFDYFKKNNFSYTLNPPPLSQYPDETDAFMFHSKQGFCGHFASAFAVMMRQAGLPARVISGYQGGTYDESAQFWQIRSRDAHAWVEVWLPEQKQWRRIDPTAAVSNRTELGLNELLGNTSGLFSWYQLQKIGAKIQFHWQSKVVEYDTERQNALFRRLGLGRVSASSVLAILLIGGALAATPIALWYRRRFYQRQNPLADGFLRLKEQLTGDRDFALSLTAHDFLDELQQQGSLNNEIKQLVKDYIALRYGTDTPPKTQVLQWARRCKKICRKYRVE